MEALLLAGQHAQAELHCEQRKLREAHALAKYKEVICKAAHALRRVASMHLYITASAKSSVCSGTSAIRRQLATRPVGSTTLRQSYAARRFSAARRVRAEN